MLKTTKKVFIVLLAVFLIGGTFLGVNALNNADDETYLDFNGVTISKQDYLSIKENFKDYKQIKICNIENNDCILLTKLP